MKKYLPALCIIYSLTAHSQNFNKGDKLFGGSVSFNTYTNNNNSFSSNGSNIGLSPSFSWLIKDNLAFGIRGGINYEQNKSENQAPSDNKSTTYNGAAGVFLRKYKTVKDKFGMYFDNNLSFYVSNTKNESGTPVVVSKNESKGVNYRFSPGVFYMFSSHFIGEANIGGVYAGYRKGGSTKSFNAGLSFLQYFNVGINYRFEAKKKA